MKKRIFALLLVLAMGLSLAACSAPAADNSEQPSETPSASSEPTTSTQPAIEADLSKTDSAKQLYEEIRAGMIDRMSYGFIVSEDEWTVTHDRDSGKTTELRTIKKVRKVYDVSAVSIPANNGTSLATRKLCDGVIAKHEAERLGEERAKMQLKLRIKLMEV